MNVRILRGAHEVGGSCIEVSAAGRRIVLDTGLPMGELPPGRSLLPDVAGLWGPGDGSLLGVFISHAHPDHIGLADLVDSSVPVFLGERAAALCRESCFFAPSAVELGPTRALVDDAAVSLGPFTVTPLRVDHGIDDAFALLVEAGGRRLLYSGDLRGHGRDSACIDRLARRAGKVDVLLMEGTRIGRLEADTGRHEPTEAEVEEQCAELFAGADGAVLAFASGQNLDRIESIVRAADRVGRTAVLDLYGATMWTATGRPWPCEARVRLPRSQRWRVVTTGAFERTRAIRSRRIYDDALVRNADDLVILPRTSALGELESLGVLLGADAVWSMWAGYLELPYMRPTMRILRRNGVAIHTAHASGHACPQDIRRLVDAVAPSRVVPIHTEYPEAMAQLVGSAEAHSDGEWWTV